MPSKTSFFNRGIASNTLRRFWPLWTVYLAFLLLILPQALANDLDAIHEGRLLFMDYHAVNIGIIMVYISFGVAVLTAMAMFHYLYQAKSCSMMNALPIRRETMFWTAYLMGLVPLLLADLIAVLLCALLYSTRGYLHLSALGDVLLLLVFGNIAFYGFAVFCAMLTGNLLVLPAVYTVLLFTAFVAEWAARYLLSRFVFGMGLNMGLRLSFLSPLVHLSRMLRTLSDGDMGNYVTGSYQLLGMSVIAAYAAVGILLSAASLLLYRCRQMETATDVVAIRILKPVFKYCLCFGTALVFASMVYSNFLDTRLYGRAAAGMVLLLMLIGGFIGYFAAEMMIQKTLKIFSGQWRGFFAACAVIVLFVGVAEFDLFRYETRVPAEEQVKSVQLYSAGYTAELTEAEEIASAETLHRAVIADKRNCEKGIGTDLGITYTLQNGRTVTREYALPLDTMLQPDSLQRQAEELLNTPLAILARVSTDLPVDREHLRYAGIYYTFRADTGVEEEYRNEDWNLTFEEAESFYREGILPDAKEGMIGRAHLVQDQAYYDNTYAGGIDFYLQATGDQYTRFMNISIETASENTLRWIREHTALELKTYTELGLDDPEPVPVYYN
jgi:ABC-2 type transport system permease protein